MGTVTRPKSAGITVMHLGSAVPEQAKCLVLKGLAGLYPQKPYNTRQK
jgi:hypothetical protein